MFIQQNTHEQPKKYFCRQSNVHVWMYSHIHICICNYFKNSEAVFHMSRDNYRLQPAVDNFKKFRLVIYINYIFVIKDLCKRLFIKKFIREQVMNFSRLCSWNNNAFSYFDSSKKIIVYIKQAKMLSIRLQKNN